MPPAQGAQAPNTIDNLVAKYEAIGTNPALITNLTEIDEIRRLEFANRMERAVRERDPALKAQRTARAFGEVRGAVAYFLGKELLPGINVPENQRLALFTATGTEYLNDKYNVGRE